MSRTLWKRLQEDLEEAQALEPVTGSSLLPHHRSRVTSRRVAAAITAAAAVGAVVGYLGLVSHQGQSHSKDKVAFRGEDSLEFVEDVRVDLELEAETQGKELLRRLGDGQITRLYPKEFVSFGSATACRRDESDSSTDGGGAAQTLSGVNSLDDCKQRCAKKHCRGLEWSQGRCELWLVRVGYVASPKGSSSEPADSECFARVLKGSYTDFGSNTVCRINQEDMSATGYGSALVKKGVSKQACYALCRSVLGVQCAGVEIQPRSGCEMWTQPIGHHKSAGGYRCAPFQTAGFAMGRPFFVRSKLSLKCLGDDLKMGECLFMQGISHQSWQLYNGHILSTSGSGESCLDIAESGKAQMVRCSSASSHWERTSDSQLKITTGPKTGQCLEFAGSQAHAEECKKLEFSWVSFGEGTACRLNKEDKTEDGEGTVQKVQANTLEECRAECQRNRLNCKGFQFTESASSRRLQALSGGPIPWVYLPQMCLAVDEQASNIRLWTCKQGEPSQQFVLPASGEGPIRWAERPDFCWYSDSNSEDSLKIQKCDEKDEGQKWVLHHSDKFIKSKSTGKCVDVYKEWEEEGTNIITWPCKDIHSRHNQEFIFDVPYGTTPAANPDAPVVTTKAPATTKAPGTTKAPDNGQGGNSGGGTGNCALWQQPVLHAKTGVSGAQCFSRVMSGEFLSKGQNTACRADTSDNTANANGRVRIVKGVTAEECQQMCTLSKDMGECHGIEYNAGLRHCELWAIPIHHTKSANGFECLVKMNSDQFIELYPEPTRVRVQKIDFTSDDPKAVCRDGTAPAYFFRPATDPAMKRTWLMLLRGGGWCFTKETCANFWASSSSKYKGAMDKMGIFSTEKGNPLAGSNYIFMPYCSSDAHMGDAEVDGMQFRGHRIIRAALRSLKSLGMKSGDTFVFAGWSAGARAAMAHLDSVHQDLPSGVKVLGYLDSPLYVEFDGFGDFADETRKATDLYVARELTQPCEDKWGKAERWKCVFGQYRLPMVKSRFLLIASQGDKYQVERIAREGPLREKFMQKTREVMWGLGENAAIHSSACFNHAVTENWAFNEEMVAATPRQLGTTNCRLSGKATGCRVSMSLSLNLTLAAAFAGGKLPRVIETCSGFHCGRWCLPLKECKPGGKYSDLCPERG